MASPLESGAVKSGRSLPARLAADKVFVRLPRIRVVALPLFSTSCLYVKQIFYLLRVS